MKSLQKPYQQNIALIVLTGYLIISIQSIFHHHTYNFLGENVINKSSETNQIDPKMIGTEEFQCVVHNTYRDLNSAIPKFIIDCDILFYRLQNLSVYNSKITFQSDPSFLNYLRAPPGYIS